MKTEFCRLAQDTDELDAKEQRLLTDLTGQLCKKFFINKINLIVYIIL